MKVYILVDIGNTNLLFGKFDNSKLIDQLRIETSIFNDEILDKGKETQKKIINFFGDNCSDCLVSGVVPDTTKNLIKFLDNLSKFDVNEIDNEYLRKIIDVDVDKPGDVGVDRLINSYAALFIYNRPLIIVDFGTATTFDLVSANGSYMGGIICPGVNLSIQSLANNTAKLPLIKIKKVDHLIGKDTNQAIESGSYWGYVSLVNGLIKRLKEQKGFKNSYVIATGGLSGIFEDDLIEIESYEPNLTLKGLNIIYNEYKK